MAQAPRNVPHRPVPRRRVETEGKWRKCDNPACAQSLFIGDVEKNLFCCKHCGHHFRVGGRRRVEMTLDPGSFTELFEGISPSDPLQFKAVRSYQDRVKEAQAKTGLKEAVVCGEGLLDGRRVVLAVMDFSFIGASMSSAVGEKITRAMEHATVNRLPAIVFCASGGARMDEGILSLMQMAKTSAAVHRHNEAGLPYITVLTDPTLAGVSASFAFLPDVILAEPRAMIGFTGARVIEQTLRVKLPEGFQEAEFLLAHGQVDKVVARKDLRSTLGQLIAYAAGALSEPPVCPEPAIVSSPTAPLPDAEVAPVISHRPHRLQKRATPRTAPRRRN
jgi:acetyl-CoA carboxylase carboxyl transferase subunit beta